MNVFEAKSLSEGYLAVLRHVFYCPDCTSSPRGLAIRECFDLIVRINHPDSKPIVTHDQARNEVIARYTKKEFELYRSMSNSVTDFCEASTFWSKIANPDGTINSAYGHLIWQNPSIGHPDYEKHRGFNGVYYTPWEWVVESLLADHSTRQAVMPFAMPYHFYRGNFDQTCTMYANFHIRDCRLNMSVSMRSQDMVKGAVYDWAWFAHVQDQLLAELIGRGIEIPIVKGTYTHKVDSVHIYEKDKEAVIRMLGTHSEHE